MFTGNTIFAGLALVGAGQLVAVFDLPRTNDNFAAIAGMAILDTSIKTTGISDCRFFFHPKSDKFVQLLIKKDLFLKDPTLMTLLFLFIMIYIWIW